MQMTIFVINRQHKLTIVNWFTKNRVNDSDKPIYSNIWLFLHLATTNLAIKGKQEGF